MKCYSIPSRDAHAEGRAKIQAAYDRAMARKANGGVDPEPQRLSDDAASSHRRNLSQDECPIKAARDAYMRRKVEGRG